MKAIRESKGVSQGDIEKKTGLIRCYISRFENGHTVPSIVTLEKFAHALEVPMYALFYDGEKPPVKLALARKTTASEREARTPHAVALPAFAGTHFATRSEAPAFHGVENGVPPQVGAGAMNYCLPRLDETPTGSNQNPETLMVPDKRRGPVFSDSANQSV